MSPILPPSEPAPMAKPAIRLLFATIERCPTFRPDVATLFGKFLPRFGVSSDLVAERAPGVAGEVSWGGGEALLVSSRGSRLRRYVENLAHYALTLLRANRARYQAIQVRDMPSVALLGLLAARLKRLPFFYWMSFPAPEGQIYLARERGLSAGLMRFLFPLLWRGWMHLFLLYRIVLPRADHVFVQSDRMREDLVGKGIERQKLTPVVMGVDLEVSVPEAIPPADDARLKGKRVLIYLGTLARGRRIEVLFDMLKILRQQFPDVLLVLVGEADDEADEKRLRKLADDAGVAEATVWTGWLPTGEAWRYVRAAEVGLAPVPRGSMLDCGSPTKVLEYLALGVPVVANDNPDQERVLREGGGGLCVPLTAHAFARAVSRLLVDEPLRRAMASSGQSYVRASRGYQTLAKLVADKYAELLHAQ
jgi:glycosyltransferase involved in cell wall biosynthesis